jgi:arginine repressor
MTANLEHRKEVKQRRDALIKMIVNERFASSHQELSEKLSVAGYIATAATTQKDLCVLGYKKVRVPGTAKFIWQKGKPYKYKPRNNPVFSKEEIAKRRKLILETLEEKDLYMMEDELLNVLNERGYNCDAHVLKYDLKVLGIKRRHYYFYEMKKNKTGEVM